MTYAERYAKDYLGKIFYYSLKNTGDENEAEELSSDITISVLQELAKGVQPESFSAWVWKIARNRYARWADKKRRKHELFDADELSEHIDLMDEEPTAEESIIQAETLALMRRELAFIRSDYRQVLVAFYIDDKSLPTIAKHLSLPLGTVKTRLIQARKILKEGMNMAREFGKLSYRPENVSFINYVRIPGKYNEPWSLCRKLIPKNILLAAYRSPMTAEELSLELGVALPYLEEEVAILEKHGLLRKTGKKYESTIPIINAEAQRKVYDKCSAVAPLMFEKIAAYLSLHDELYEKNGIRWNFGAQPEEDMRWARLMRAADLARYAVLDDGDERTERPNGGLWDIVGYEEYHGPQFEFVGEHGAGMDVRFIQYKFNYRNIASKTPTQLETSLAKALEAVCENRTADSVSVGKLLEMGYLKEENGELIPQMMVVDYQYSIVGSKGLPKEDAEKLDALWTEVVSYARDVKNFIENNVLAELSPCVMNDPFTRGIVIRNFCSMRGAVLDAALKSGYISYADDDPRFLLGTMITVNRKEE